MKKLHEHYGAVFPALLILPGLRAFHLWQQEDYGRGGLWGYRMTFWGIRVRQGKLLCRLGYYENHCIAYLSTVDRGPAAIFVSGEWRSK
jgi:hypothetical protein